MYFQLIVIIPYHTITANKFSAEKKPVSYQKAICVTNGQQVKISDLKEWNQVNLDRKEYDIP
jgi:hypothetical protein